MSDFPLCFTPDAAQPVIHLCVYRGSVLLGYIYLKRPTFFPAEAGIGLQAADLSEILEKLREEAE